MDGHFVAPTLPEKLADRRKLKAESVTMGQLFDRRLTVIWTEAKVRSQATMLSTVRILRSMIGTELVRDMDYGRLEELVGELRGRGYAEGTIRRKLNTLSAALTQATVEKDDEGKVWLPGRPKMPRVVVDNFKDRVVSREEEPAIFAAVAKRAVAEPMRPWRRFGYLLRFLIDTDCRLDKALQLVEARVERHVINDVERWSVSAVATAPFQS